MQVPTRYVEYVIILIVLITISPRLLLFFPTGGGTYGLIPGYRRESPILRIDWSPSGEEISILNDHEYYIWKYKNWNSDDQFRNRNDFEPSNFFYLPNSSPNITDASWSKTNNYLATSYLSFGTRDEPLEIRNTVNFAKDREVFSTRNRSENFTAIDWFYDTDVLLVGSDNGQIYNWDLSDPSELNHSFNSSLLIQKIRISKGNQLLALSGTANQSSIIQIYTYPEFSLTRSFNISNPVKSWEWLEDTQKIHLYYSLNSENTLYQYDFLQNTTEFLINYNQPISHFDIAEDGNTIGIMLEDRIDLTTIENLPQIRNSYDRALNLGGFAFDPTTTMFVFNSDRNLVIASIDNFEILYELPGYGYEIVYTNYIDVSQLWIILIIILSILMMSTEIVIKSKSDKKIIANLGSTDKDDNLYPE